MITYDVVIATRNRSDALLLSLPMLLAQSRPPAQIIVVDSSADPAPIREIVARAAETSEIPLRHIESAPGLPLQRNRGLREATADVVFFPDDDSLVLPGTMEKILRVYERDTDRRIGGVCGVEVGTPPAGIAESAAQRYRSSFAERVERRIRRVRYGLEKRYAPSPIHLLQWRCARAIAVPEWLGEVNALVVEHMSGFTMSFRRDAIGPVGFDETLWGYALQEDADASLGVMRAGWLLVSAQDAWIYHHKAPGGRGGARQLGFMKIANRLYLLAKHAEPDAALKRAMAVYAGLRFGQFAAGAASPYLRDQLSVGLSVWRDRRAFYEAEKAALPAVYARMRARHLDA